MKHTQCNDAAVNLLLMILSQGIVAGMQPEVEELLLALRLLHPNRAAVDLCEARIHIGGHRWDDALRVLRQLEAEGYGSPVVSALEGGCLLMLGDDEWRRCMASVIASGHDAAVAMAGIFLNVNEQPVAEGVARAVAAERV